MTTRFTGVNKTAGVSPSSWSAGWNKTSGASTAVLGAGPYFTTNTVLGNNSASGTSGHFTAGIRLVSGPLKAQTIAGTIKGQFRCSQVTSTDNFTLAVGIKVIQSDGTDRGILLAVTASDDTTSSPPELATTTPTNRRLLDAAESASISLSSLAVSDNDRIVVEVGIRQASTSTATFTLVGTVSTTGAALAENDTSTSGEPWIEFSQTIKMMNWEHVYTISNPVDSSSATNTADPTAITPPDGFTGTNDLVCMVGHQRASAAVLAVSATGGQTWTTHNAVNNTNITGRLFSAVFNGTWSANPSVDFDATTCNTAVLMCFRPADGRTVVSINQALSEQDHAAAATITVTGQTTTGSNPTITLAGWFTADDNTWGTLSGTGWISASEYGGISPGDQHRNTSGQDHSCTFAYKPQNSAGATGNVSKNEATLGNDAATTFIITFAAETAAIVLDAEAGSYLLTGTVATLEFDRQIVADVGSYSLSGQAAILQKDLPLIAGVDSYLLTGQISVLELDRQLITDAGSYLLTGTDATLNKGLTLVLDAGSYLLTGTAAGLELDRQLVAELGTYLLTGNPASLEYVRQIITEAGGYLLIGADADLTVSGAPPPVTIVIKNFAFGIGPMGKTRTHPHPEFGRVKQ